MQVATFDATLQLPERLDPWLVSLGVQTAIEQETPRKPAEPR